MFYNGDKLYYFLFDFLHSKPFWKKECALETDCTPKETNIIPFRTVPFSEDGKFKFERGGPFAIFFLRM